MKLLDNEELQRMVDYSFGDHSGVLGGVPNAYMKKANFGNGQFAKAIENHKGEIMTLFIDNIRLYKRPLQYSDWLHKKPISSIDRKWLSNFNNEDLLYLCSHFNKKFIIFTAFEDTPLDDYIWSKIPDNVVAIHSANGVVFGGKIHPFPHGLERIMYYGYNHHEILREFIEDTTQPTNGLLVCHRDDTGARGSLKDMFKDKTWATVAQKLDYEPYLQAIKDHKFVLCPSGNGIGSARNWETLYMRRVPVMEDHPYKRKVFKGFPILFVKNYSDVTEDLLKENQSLYDEAQKFSMDLLDLEKLFNNRINI